MAYSRVSFSGIILSGRNLGMSPGCTFSWGPRRASLSMSPLTKFIMTDCAMSSRLWPVARYLAPILLASSFMSLLRNTPQYVQGLLLPETGAIPSMVTPSSSNDLRWKNTPFSSQNLRTTSTLGGRYPSMPSSMVIACTSTPFRGPKTDAIILSASMLSFPPETATAILSPAYTRICLRISLFTRLST